MDIYSRFVWWDSRVQIFFCSLSPTFPFELLLFSAASTVVGWLNREVNSMFRSMRCYVFHILWRHWVVMPQPAGSRDPACQIRRAKCSMLRNVSARLWPAFAVFVVVVDSDSHSPTDCNRRFWICGGFGSLQKARKVFFLRGSFLTRPLKVCWISLCSIFERVPGTFHFGGRVSDS